MGKCQGRYCGETITEMVAERSGRAVDEFAGFAPQPPTRPTTIATMAAADDE